MSATARLTDEERETLLCDCLCDGPHNWRCATHGEYDLLLDAATVVERVEAILAARLAATAPAHDELDKRIEAQSAVERVRALTTDPDGTPHEHDCLSPEGHGYGCHACWAESINAALAPTAAEQVHAARAVADRDAARIAGQVRASGEGREG